MTSMVKLLRTLGLLGALDAAVPESIVLPIAQLEREQRHARRRASGRAGGQLTSPARGRGRGAMRPMARSGARGGAGLHDRRGGDAVGSAHRGGIDRRSWTLRDVPVRPGVRPQRYPARAGADAAARSALQLPRSAAGRLQRSPRPARRLAARSLGNGAGQRLAGLAGTRSVEFRRGSAPLLRRHARRRGAGVPAGARARGAGRRGSPGRCARAPRQRGAGRARAVRGRAEREP